jgi:hypothetical protein
MQIDPTGLAARNSKGADQSPPIPYAELADRLATHGPAALEGALRRLIRDARCHGVTPLLVTILADPAECDVARQRAFGLIVGELERRRKTRAYPAHTASDAA